MEFYLTCEGDKLHLPLSPDNITVKQGTLALSFQIIKTGEHKIPRGNSVTGYSWNGVFPDQSMAKLGFVKDWQSPPRIIEKIEGWMLKNKVIRFLVTDTGINSDVIIDTFSYTYVGTGRANYSLSLSSYRPLEVTNAPPQPEVVIPKAASNSTSADSSASSTAAPSSGDGGGSTGQSSNSTDPKKKQPLSVSIPTTKLTGIATAAAKTALVNAVRNVNGTLQVATAAQAAAASLSNAVSGAMKSILTKNVNTNTGSTSKTPAVKAPAATTIVKSTATSPALQTLNSKLSAKGYAVTPAKK